MTGKWDTSSKCRLEAQRLLTQNPTSSTRSLQRTKTSPPADRVTRNARDVFGLERNYFKWKLGATERNEEHQQL